MEHFRNLVKEANRAFETADHLTYMTYPVVNDKKILMLIIEHLHKAVSKSMEAFLYYDALYKRISVMPRNFDSQLDIFRNYTTRRYNLSQESVVLIREIDDLIRHREASPIEFSRRESYVIASNNYKLKILSIEKVKKFVSQTKYLLERLNEVLTEVDRRFS